MNDAVKLASVTDYCKEINRLTFRAREISSKLLDASRSRDETLNRLHQIDQADEVLATYTLGEHIIARKTTSDKKHVRDILVKDLERENKFIKDKLQKLSEAISKIADSVDESIAP
jgi:hypothetical protein